MKRLLSAASVLALAFTMTAAKAADESFTMKEQAKMAGEKVMGWTKSANLGANISFSSSKDVVGQTDGTSETYGANLKSTFNYNTELSEWKNTVSLIETTTKTPAVPRFVKSSDELSLESLYLRSLESYPAVGPYGRLNASTSIFKGEDIQGSDKSYVIQDENGNVTSGPFNASTVRLTDGFKPLTTKESVGFFWKAKEEENVKILVRLGFGAVQVQAADQYAVNGKDASGNIIVQKLENVNQAGLESGFSIKGKFDEKTSYEAGLETLTPFINNKKSGDNRDAFRLTNVEGFAKLSSNITSWASFGYDYKMKLQPQLVDRVQNIHMIVINANYNLF
ncbi:MAG TPA: hypothetical protein DCL41_02565 [Bdellovibrionales bacterium]|nr:hypothetical protein [Bdellovibrionales bacterium]|tara:strand:- start:181 stop:1191 length:1011 start_codon:yes stop_codon:yes gene_type:complete